ncbi:MAG TPA: Rrf2 family transcriptional regulator [Dehalococcoidia bacterium]|nr:Rrf2 family transcriptional regulator [Dehalococcoidia bacterium]
MRALVYLAIRRKEEPVAVKVLAKAQDIPNDFAHKILRKLTKAELLEGYRGSQGGFILARSPTQITLLQTVDAIQGPVVVRKCCLGLDVCPRRPSCLVSVIFEELHNNLEKFLENIALTEVLKSRYPQPHHFTFPVQ